MVVSQNKGTPIWTPISYYGDPQNGAHNFGKFPYAASTEYVVIEGPSQLFGLMDFVRL